MYQFVAIDDNEYMLVRVEDDTNVIPIIDHMTIDDMGEIVIGAVSIINPAMGDMLRNLLAQNAS